MARAASKEQPRCRPPQLLQQLIDARSYCSSVSSLEGLLVIVETDVPSQIAKIYTLFWSFGALFETLSKSKDVFGKGNCVLCGLLK
jgi:hypothetical protein